MMLHVMSVFTLVVTCIDTFGLLMYELYYKLYGFNADQYFNKVSTLVF